MESCLADAGVLERRGNLGHTRTASRADAAVAVATERPGTLGQTCTAARAEAAGALLAAELPAIEEPVALLGELRRLAADRPARARSEAPGRLASVARAGWQDRLAESGVPSGVVGPAFDAARREIWLWVEGDRNWAQLAPHLAGRVIRRLPRL